VEAMKRWEGGSRGGKEAGRSSWARRGQEVREEIERTEEKIWEREEEQEGRLGELRRQLDLAGEFVVDTRRLGPAFIRWSEKRLWKGPPRNVMTPPPPLTCIAPILPPSSNHAHTRNAYQPPLIDCPPALADERHRLHAHRTAAENARPLGAGNIFRRLREDEDGDGEDGACRRSTGWHEPRCRY
jgi:hypothetical protein